MARNMSESSLMHRVEQNDPELVELKIRAQRRPADGKCYVPRDNDDWERLGTAIGQNTHLKSIDLQIEQGWGRGDEVLLKERGRLFFRGFVLNRSIQSLSFNMSKLWGDFFSQLVPFFKNNAQFDSLGIMSCACIDHGEGGETFNHQMFEALSEFNSLKEFSFTLLFIGRNDSKALMNALSGHLGMKKLCLAGRHIGTEEGGCNELVAILQNPEIKLAELQFSSRDLDNSWATALAAGLSRNRTLISLDLSKTDLLTEWHVIFESLRSSRVENLDLGGCKIDDDAFLSLVRLLDSNACIKSLNLRNLRYQPRNVSRSEWQSLFNTLRAPKSKLEHLNIRGNDINNSSAMTLGNALTQNFTLKTLDISANELPADEREVLSTAVLQNPQSALKTLIIEASGFQDNHLAALANSLTTNKKLEKLVLSGLSPYFMATFIGDGWEAFSRVLCSPTSIGDTFLSNHTLRKLTDEESEVYLPQGLRLLLQVNAINSKFNAARQKIIMTHFGGCNINLQPFSDMKQKVWPQAMSWMAKDYNGFSLLYAFVRTTSGVLVLNNSKMTTPIPKRQKSA